MLNCKIIYNANTLRSRKTWLSPFVHKQYSPILFVTKLILFLVKTHNYFLQCKVNDFTSPHGTCFIIFLYCRSVSVYQANYLQHQKACKRKLAKCAGGPMHGVAGCDVLLLCLVCFSQSSLSSCVHLFTVKYFTFSQKYKLNNQRVLFLYVSLYL